MSRPVEIEVVGVERIMRRFGRLPQVALDAVARATNDVAKDVFTESQHRVPVDTGNLKASGRVTPKRDGSSVTAELSYGGTAAAYAVIVHETHRSRSKYLEGPAREATNEFADAVKNAISSAIKGL